MAMTSISGEQIEQAALESLHGAADDDLRNQLGLGVESIGSGMQSIASTLPASAIVINRVLGLGLAEPMRSEWLDEMAGRYARKCPLEQPVEELLKKSAQNIKTGKIIKILYSPQRTQRKTIDKNRKSFSQNLKRKNYSTILLFYLCDLSGKIYE